MLALTHELWQLLPTEGALEQGLSTRITASFCTIRPPPLLPFLSGLTYRCSRETWLTKCGQAKSRWLATSSSRPCSVSAIRYCCVHAICCLAADGFAHLGYSGLVCLSIRKPGPTHAHADMTSVLWCPPPTPFTLCRRHCELHGHLLQVHAPPDRRDAQPDL